MRTTVSLDDAALNAARLTVTYPTRQVNGLLVFDPPTGAPPVASHRVRELEDDL